ncbi:MAG TPA: RodZ domain-containing protein [Stellaceae bacterium]|nr:RodZ domain-containing protein [Stellaceae bacterium]
MALFSRSLKPEGDAALPGGNGDSGAESTPRHTIGDLLRDTRKSYGGDIDRIAAILKIRPSYLSAIEESQYDKLPGPVYAQGFVRAYAVHLGLDGDEAIRRFKQEVAGFEVSRDLSFPVPLAERSIPGGTMVLAALILALCGYGLWYYVSTSDRSHPERVSAVPPDLIAATKKPVPDAASPTSVPATPAPTTVEPGAPSANTATSPAPILTAPSATVTTAPSATPAAPPLSPPGTTSRAAPPPAASVPAVPSTTPAPVTTATSPSSPTSSSGSPPQTASAPAATAAPPPTDAAAAANAPPIVTRIYGAPADMPARIVVRAIKDSWVQVRNGDEVLIQRTLHPGDSVRVPDISGLALRTGNGSGIQFEIDGKLFKPLGGTVRTIALDPNRLAANNGNPPP